MNSGAYCVSLLGGKRLLTKVLGNRLGSVNFSVAPGRGRGAAGGGAVIGPLPGAGRFQRCPGLGGVQLAAHLTHRQLGAQQRLLPLGPTVLFLSFLPPVCTPLLGSVQCPPPGIFHHSSSLLGQIPVISHDLWTSVQCLTLLELASFSIFKILK